MSNDGGDSAALTVGRFCFPCIRWKIVDQILIDSVVSVEGVEQR
jgi:hypothetical protein